MVCASPEGLEEHKKRVHHEPSSEYELDDSGDPAPPGGPSRAAANSVQCTEHAVIRKRKSSSDSDKDEDDGGDGKQSDLDDWLKSSKVWKDGLLLGWKPIRTLGTGVQG